MKTKWIYDSKFARILKVNAITLYPFVFVALDYDRVPNELIYHEFVHIKQIRAQGWFRFYATYLYEYFKLRAMGLDADEAYFAIPAEIEAFEKESTLELTAAEFSEAIPPR